MRRGGEETGLMMDGGVELGTAAAAAFEVLDSVGFRMTDKSACDVTDAGEASPPDSDEG